jgi:hypothetical protein
MYKATINERLDLHKYSLAAGAWAEARIAINKIVELEQDGSNEARSTAHTMRVGFYILYGRPFKQRPGLKIDEDIVPQSLRSVHNGLIILRDKMFAHSDKDLVSSAGDPINTVLIEIKSRSVSFGINTLKPLKNSTDAYLDLLDQIIKTAVYRRDKIWRRWSKHLQLPVGSRWILNFGTDSDEVLKPCDKEARVFSHLVGDVPATRLPRAT